MDNFLSMDNSESIRMIESLIRDIVQQEIVKAKFNKNVTAKIITADNVAKTASVQLLSDGVTIDGIKNRSGEDLATDELVEITFINNSSSSFVITIRH